MKESRKNKTQIERILEILQKFNVTEFENKNIKIKLIPKQDVVYNQNINSYKYEEMEKEDLDSKKFKGVPTIWDGI